MVRICELAINVGAAHSACFGRESCVQRGAATTMISAQATRRCHGCSSPTGFIALPGRQHSALPGNSPACPWPSRRLSWARRPNPPPQPVEAGRKLCALCEQAVDARAVGPPALLEDHGGFALGRPLEVGRRVAELTNRCCTPCVLYQTCTALWIASTSTLPVPAIRQGPTRAGASCRGAPMAAAARARCHGCGGSASQWPDLPRLQRPSTLPPAPVRCVELRLAVQRLLEREDGKPVAR